MKDADDGCDDDGDDKDDDLPCHDKYHRAPERSLTHVVMGRGELVAQVGRDHEVLVVPRQRPDVLFDGGPAVVDVDAGAEDVEPLQNQTTISTARGRCLLVYSLGRGKERA